MNSIQRDFDDFVHGLHVISFGLSSMAIRMFKNLKKGLRIDSDSTFYELPLFWLAVSIPLAISLYLAWPLMDGLNWTRSKSFYETILEDLKFPLWIASFSFVLGIMVARMHRSKQGHDTLRETIDSNNFTQRFKHEEEFNRFASGIKSYTIDSFFDKHVTVQLDLSNSLYLFYFPENKQGLKRWHHDADSISDFYLGVLLSIDEKIPDVGSPLVGFEVVLEYVFEQFKENKIVVAHTYPDPDPDNEESLRALYPLFFSDWRFEGLLILLDRYVLLCLKLSEFMGDREYNMERYGNVLSHMPRLKAYVDDRYPNGLNENE